MFSELAKADLDETTNIIITSDHGMASLTEDKLIFLDPNGSNEIQRNTLDKYPTSRLGRLRHCVTHRGIEKIDR